MSPAAGGVRRRRWARGAALVAVPVLLVSAMAWHAVDTAAERSLRARADEQLDNAMRLVGTGAGRAVDGTWRTDGRGPLEALGVSDVEPPWNGLLQEAVQYPTRRDFSENGRAFAAFGRPWATGEALVTLVDLDRPAGERRRGHLAVVAGAVVALAVGTVAVELARRRLTAGADRRVARQEALLADAAHEMRTPLAVIRASSSQALARPRSTEEYVRVLSEVRAASERAAVGVEQLLDAARLASGQLRLQRAPLRLDLLGEEVMAANDRDGVVLDAPPGPPVVVDADAPLLRQAVDNLVRNACRRAGRVSLHTTVEGGEAVLRVLDDGPGFDAAALPHLFDRFGRFDEGGSAGLGLSIVAAVVHAHGGSVVAANRPEGGAAVTVRLPLHRP